jgi:hypothetical protein
MTPMRTQFAAILSCLCLSACLNVVPEERDSGQKMTSTDGGANDSGVVDAGIADAGEFDAGTPDAGELDAGTPDAGELDAGTPPDAGDFDAGAPDAGEFDAGTPDAGEFDAGSDAGEIDAGDFDAGELDAGDFDAGFDAGVFDAGPPPCTGVDPCIASDYRFEQAPDCGSFCYYDEAHNLAVRGQANDPSGFAQYARGQLLDGVRGNPDYLVNMGADWVGWLYRDANLIFRFPTARQFNVICIGVNNHGTGGINSPSEVQIQFSDDDVTFGMPYVFRRSMGTLPVIPPGTRADWLLVTPGAQGRYVRITLVYSAAWTMVDEFEFF